MHATRLIFEAMPKAEREPLPESTVDGVCCVTGEVEPCIRRSHLIGRSFMDQALLRAPGSALVGAAAYAALKYKWERMSSWITDGKTFDRLDRQSARQLVIGGVSKPVWAGYITTSYKKHGALTARVNSGGKQVWRFENVTVDCSDRNRLDEWWGVMTSAQRDGVSRMAMESFAPPPGIIKHIGVGVWERFRRWAADKHTAPLYGLLCYLLPSQEELKQASAEKE